MLGDPTTTLCQCLWFLMEKRKWLYPETFNEKTLLHKNYHGMVTVTDSRNRTVNKSAVVSVVSYASPKLSSVKSERCNASGETDNDGTYFLSTTSAVFPSCLGKNALTLTVKYKRTDLKNYGNEVQINPGSNVCANNDLDPEYSCDVLYTLSDEFNTVTYSDFVSTAVYLMHFLHGGRTTSRSCS